MKKHLEYFSPYRDKREALARDPDKVQDILKEGARKARAVAQKTLERVYRRVGLLPPG
jgi:tryptophanyl-tRNA synthetase